MQKNNIRIPFEGNIIVVPSSNSTTTSNTHVYGPLQIFCSAAILNGKLSCTSPLPSKHSVT